MLNLVKGLIIVALTSLIVTGMKPNDVTLDRNQTLSYIDEAYLSSNRMTQPDVFDADRVEAFENEYQLPYTDQILQDIGYTYTIENTTYKLYFDAESYSVMLYDKVNDYYISSRAELQGLSGIRENNTATRNLMNSGLWVSYVRKANVTTATEETESIYSLADVSYVTDGSVRDDQDYFSVYEKEAGSFDESAVTVDVIETTQHFDTTITYHDLGFELRVVLTLTEEGLEVFVPAEDIVEDSDIYGLTKVTIFPYFGAVRENLAPGYMVIPDGSGALIRFDDPINETLKARFYGPDAGLNLSSLAYLSIPVAGMIHQVNEQGYYVRVDEGAVSTGFEASFWSSNSRYHKMALTHTIRPIYKAIINQAGDGREQIPEALTTIDYKATYVMLGSNANYSGIANDYQSYLLDQNILEEKTSDSEMPILLSMLLGDQTPAFLGTSYLEMTSPEDALSMVTTLQNEGVNNMTVELLGWSKDGHIDQSPYRLRNISGLNTLRDALLEQGITSYLYQEYVYGSSLSSRIFYNRDVARNYSRLKMELTIGSLNSQAVEAYYIYPEQSADFASSDQLTELSMPMIGHTLFSYFDDGFYTRDASLDYYQSILSMTDQLMLYAPSLYAWTYMDAYQAMPMMHSNYYFYTDVIPFIPMILKGIVPYFSEPLNFNALGDTMLLTMIDYGMFPSYVLTEKPTETMRYTRSSIYFTTQFDVFKESIVSNYDLLSTYYDAVKNATIVSRNVLELGVVQVTYSNDVQMIINYTNQPYTYLSKTVEARAAEVYEI